MLIIYRAVPPYDQSAIFKASMIEHRPESLFSSQLFIRTVSVLRISSNPLICSSILRSLPTADFLASFQHNAGLSERESNS